MPRYDTEQVTRALLAKLYQQMTVQPDVGEARSAMPEDRFISWCVPGIPFRKKDFRFALRGIGGSLAGAPGSSGGSDGSQTEGETGSGSSNGEASGSEDEGTEAESEDRPELSAGEEVRQRAMSADHWARMSNFIPNTEGIFGPEGQKKMYDTAAFDQDGASIASIYENVLKYSEVAAMPLTSEQKQRLKRFRNKLTTTKEKEDLMTGEMKEVEEASALVKRYNQYRQKFLDAVMLYNSKRLNALNAEDSAAVQDWSINEQHYRTKVEGAYDQWVTAGYKNQVEKMRAYIDQVTQRNLNLWKDDLLDKMDRTRLTNPVTNARFQWTSVVPARFATADSWNSYKFSHNEIETHLDRKSNQWSAGGGAFGLFGGGASGSMSRSSREIDTSNFRLSCDVTQVMISRPWFSAEFLFSNAWRFGPDMPELTNLTETLSDGKTPPEEGSMIAYPTAAIFARNVTVRMSEFESESSSFKREISGGGTFSLGPVALGGSHGEGEYEYDYESEFDSGALNVSGMQLLGFRCKLLPKLPNPSDDVDEWK